MTKGLGLRSPANHSQNIHFPGPQKGAGPSSQSPALYLFHLPPMSKYKPWVPFSIHGLETQLACKHFFLVHRQVASFCTPAGAVSSAQSQVSLSCPLQASQGVTTAIGFLGAAERGVLRVPYRWRPLTRPFWAIWLIQNCSFRGRR